jgi:hypothetical protein
MLVVVLVALQTRTMYKVDLICNTLFVLLNAITMTTTAGTMVLVILLGFLLEIVAVLVAVVPASSSTTARPIVVCMQQY